MNIDLLPINALSLESCAAADAHTGIVHTLTLQLALDPVLPFHQAMSGEATAGSAPVPHVSMLRASVIPAVGEAITLTF